MPKTITTTDRKTLVRLASSMEKGTDARRAILLGLKKTAVSKLVREWERLLEQIIEEGDRLGRAARGFGARMAADMSVSEAMAVLDGYADNLAKLENYISTLSRAAQNAPDTDKDALKDLLEQASDQKWNMSSAEAQAKQALAQYEKDTTRGKLRTGFNRLVKLAKAQWPLWKHFTVKGGAPVYVSDRKGGYGKATLEIKGLNPNDENEEVFIDLAYRASTGEMLGSFNGKEVFRKVGGKWPLKTVLKEVARVYPALSGSCELPLTASTLEKVIKHWVAKAYPGLDVEVANVPTNQGTKWAFYSEGNELGTASVSGYTGWGNIGYYHIGAAKYDYDKWTHSQCPPSIDTKKFLHRLTMYLADKIDGVAPEVYVAPAWKGDRREITGLTGNHSDGIVSVKVNGTVFAIQEDQNGGWLGTRYNPNLDQLGRGSWISADGGGPIGAWGYSPTPFKSKSKLKAVIDKKVKEIEDVENKRRRK